MYSVARIQADQARDISEFFQPHLFESKGIDNCIFFMGYDTELMEVVSAAAVYPAESGARLLSISVSKDHTGQGLGRKLIEYIALDLGYIYAVYKRAIPTLVVSEIFDKRIWDNLGPFLEKCGFSNTACDGLTEVTLEDINGSELISKAKKHGNSNIIPLKDVSGNALRSFGNRMAKLEMYPGIDSKILDPDLTMFYVSDDKIRGCILMSKLSDESLVNEWVYLDSEVKDKLALISMLAESARVAQELYPAETRVSFLPVNEVSIKLLNKIIPDAEVSSEIRTYERSLRIF